MQTYVKLYLKRDKARVLMLFKSDKSSLTTNVDSIFFKIRKIICLFACFLKLLCLRTSISNLWFLMFFLNSCEMFLKAHWHLIHAHMGLPHFVPEQVHICICGQYLKPILHRPDSKAFSDYV